MDLTSDQIHPFRVLWGSCPGMKQAKQDVDVILAWNYVVIYVLCEALHCHARKCQVRYFARNDSLSFVHEPRKDEQ